MYIMTGGLYLNNFNLISYSKYMYKHTCIIQVLIHTRKHYSIITNVHDM